MTLLVRKEFWPGLLVLLYKFEKVCIIVEVTSVQDPGVELEMEKCITQE